MALAIGTRVIYIGDYSTCIGITGVIVTEVDEYGTQGVRPDNAPTGSDVVQYAPVRYWKRETATDKRYAGIKSVSDRFVGRDFTVTNEALDDQREEIAAAIRNLSYLGRTARWCDAIGAWARAIEIEDTANLRWAFFQYGIWAGHSA